MEPITVNAGRDGFECAGKPWFFLADTLWSAFSNIRLEDWERYLRRRELQGFNAVQINTMAQPDRSLPDLGILPYASEDGGASYDFSRPNQEWWDRARIMCQMAEAHGIRPVLVLFWGIHAPANWMDIINPDRQVMTDAEVERHVRLVVEILGEFEPLYLLSGDVDIVQPACVAFYEHAAHVLAEAAPQSLKGCHLMRANSELPQCLVDLVDFYMFQSGHNADNQDMAWKLPLEFAAKYPRKPMVNGEPCYEHMGYSHRRYGRYEASDIRYAAWTSLLSGAYAGITYGAYGIWNWRDNEYLGDTDFGETFDTPIHWMEALQLPGAWDYAACARILRQAIGAGDPDFGEIHLEPAQDLLDDDTDRIRVARSGNRILAYLPTTRELRLAGVDVRDVRHAWAIELATQRVMHLGVRQVGESAYVSMPPVERDALVVVEIVVN